MSSMDRAKMDAAKDKSKHEAKLPDPLSKKANINTSAMPDNTHSLSAPYYQRPVRHPNFDPSRIPLDPNRPLSDIPSPVRREQAKLKRIYNDKDTVDNNDTVTAKSPQELLVSPSLAAHLEFLQAGNLIELPPSFTKAPIHASAYPLLSPLLQLNLLDMGDIFRVIQQVQHEGFVLTRYGIDKSGSKNEASAPNYTATTQKRLNVNTHATASDANTKNNHPDMINDIYAPEWELILYPEHFDNGINSLETDTLACSVAVHILKQCQTRKTVNKSFTAKQICKHMRSYILSQCRINPSKCERYRQIRLFEGHVIVAAKYLGLQTRFVATNDCAKGTHTASPSTANDGIPNYEVYLNVSSRNSLFVRYPNISDYFINGWT